MNRYTQLKTLIHRDEYFKPCSLFYDQPAIEHYGLNSFVKQTVCTRETTTHKATIYMLIYPVY